MVWHYDSGGAATGYGATDAVRGIYEVSVSIL
jgi:hypothetical protein